MYKQSLLMAPVFPFAQRHKRLLQLFVAQMVNVRYRYKPSDTHTRTTYMNENAKECVQM